MSTPPPSIPVALFVRVSSRGQDYSRQIADLTMVAERQGYTIAHIVSEKGSATKRSNVQRPEVEQLLTLCRAKVIRKVLVTEFSRLGRRRSETPALMEAITQAGVSIYAHNLDGPPLRSGNTVGQWQTQPDCGHCHRGDD